MHFHNVVRHFIASSEILCFLCCEFMASMYFTGLCTISLQTRFGSQQTSLLTWNNFCQQLESILRVKLEADSVSTARTYPGHRSTKH